MAKSNGDKEALKPDWNKFDGLVEVGDTRIAGVARVLERAGPAVALAGVAPYLAEPLVQILAVALAGAIGIIQAAAELVRRTREAPHDPRTQRRREERA
ncbi:MAG: hypothetical protein IT379_11825 [Deltaproteobacteria bacterium]|nr:hypothetical protein [Deltaproteobacteria bacterium]